jgi:hypothetical protein
MFDDFGLPFPRLIFLVIGMWCLAAGRRSLGLIVALTGLYLGGRLAKFYWSGDSSLPAIIFAVLAGLAGLVLARVSRTAASIVAAFAIGGFVFSSLLAHWRMMAPQYEGVVFIILGLLSATFVVFMYDLGLVTISSLLGAALMAQISGTEGAANIALFAGLALTGILIQTGIMGKDFSRSRRAADNQSRI